MRYVHLDHLKFLSSFLLPSSLCIRVDDEPDEDGLGADYEVRLPVAQVRALHDAAEGRHSVAAVVGERVGRHCDRGGVEVRGAGRRKVQTSISARSWFGFNFNFV